MDSALQPIEHKVDEGIPLAFEDGLTLFRTRDIHSLGRMARTVKRRKSGDKVYYVLNRYINSTNVCYAGCKFCAFAVDEFKEKERVVRMAADTVFNKAFETGLNFNQIHIVGGHDPRQLSLDYWLPLMRRFKQRAPHVQLSLFTAAEIDYMAKRHRMNYPQIVRALKEAGLDNVNGGGAEIFAKATRDKIIRGKADADENGAASFSVVPSSLSTPWGIQTSMEVVAVDDQGTEIARRGVRIPCGPAGDFLVRTDKAVYDGGDTMTLTVLDSGREPVFVDLSEVSFIDSRGLGALPAALIRRQQRAEVGDTLADGLARVVRTLVLDRKEAGVAERAKLGHDRRQVDDLLRRKLIRHDGDEGHEAPWARELVVRLTHALRPPMPRAGRSARDKAGACDQLAPAIGGDRPHEFVVLEEDVSVVSASCARMSSIASSANSCSIRSIVSWS